MNGIFFHNDSHSLKKMKDEMNSKAGEMHEKAYLIMQSNWESAFRGSGLACPATLGEGLITGLGLCGVVPDLTPEDVIVHNFQSLEVIPGLQKLCINGAIQGNQLAIERMQAEAKRNIYQFCGQTFGFFVQAMIPEYLETAQSIYLMGTGMEWDCEVHDTTEKKQETIRHRFKESIDDLSSYKDLVNSDLEGLRALSKVFGVIDLPMVLDAAAIRAGHEIARGLETQLNTYVLDGMKQMAKDAPPNFLELITLAAESKTSKLDPESFDDLIKALTYLVNANDHFGGMCFNDKDGMEKLWLTLFDVVQTKEDQNGTKSEE